ncbi:MAG: Calx-beta domain-containing protein, partial [Phycisphaerales bacterium]
MFRSLGNASHLASVEPLESRQMLSIAAVSIRAAAASTAEGVAASKAAAIVIERSGGDLASPLAVSFTLGGTADADDYASLPTDVVIPARARLLRIPVVAVDDAAAENPEQVVITLATSDAYAVVSNRRVATITIND